LVSVERGSRVTLERSQYPSTSAGEGKYLSAGLNKERICRKGTACLAPTDSASVLKAKWAGNCIAVPHPTLGGALTSPHVAKSSAKDKEREKERVCEREREGGSTYRKNGSVCEGDRESVKGEW